MGDLDVERRVREIVADQLGITEEDVTPDATLGENLGADSLDLIELFMALEEEFGIEISEQMAEKIETVADLIGFLDNRVH